MRRILWIATLLAVIAFAVVYDRLDRRGPQVDFVHTPPTTYATTTLPPHPATPHRNP